MEDSPARSTLAGRHLDWSPHKLRHSAFSIHFNVRMPVGVSFSRDQRHLLPHIPIRARRANVRPARIAKRTHYERWLMSREKEAA
jgi:hypothetical protein